MMFIHLLLFACLTFLLVPLPANAAIRLTMFWTTSWDTFQDRHEAVLESYVIHHPSNLLIDVYYLHNDGTKRIELMQERYCNVTFYRMDSDWMAEHAANCPFGSWLTETPADGRYYYSHLTDFLRFCLLYLKGGVYSDFDALLLRPLDPLLEDSTKNGLLIGKDEIGTDEQCLWCLGGGRHYAAPGLMIAKSLHLQILYHAMQIAFAPGRYRPDVFGWAGPQAITKAIREYRRGQVVLLDTWNFYPVNWKQAGSLFEAESAHSGLWTRLKRQKDCYSLHFYGTATRYLSPQPDSIIHRLTHLSNPLIVFNEVWDTEWNTSLLDIVRIRHGTSVKLSVQHGLLKYHDSANQTVILSHSRSAWDLNRALGNVQYEPIEGHTEDLLLVSLYSARDLIASEVIPVVFSMRKSVTIVSKTFGRMDKITELVDSFLKHYPRRIYGHIQFLVGNDGLDAQQYHQDFPVDKFNYLSFKYDIGLSKGRNRLLEKVRTKYVLLLDDDFVFTDESDISKLISLLSFREFDIVGAKSPQDVSLFQFEYSGLIEKTADGEILKLVQGSHGIIDGCSIVDFVPNLFAARSESLMSKLRWDEELKLGEHEDFFWRAKQAGLRVATCPHVSFIHKQTHFWENRTEYDRMRLRVYSFMAESLRKNRLKELHIMGKVVMRLMDISLVPIVDISVRLVGPFEACIVLSPDRPYYRYKLETPGRNDDLIIYSSTVIPVSDLEANTDYPIKIWAGNHTHFACRPLSVLIRTPSISDNLLTDASFDAASPVWKGTLDTPFSFVTTFYSYNYSEPIPNLLTARTSGRALVMSLAKQSPLPQYVRFHQFYHSVFQVIRQPNVHCRNGGRVVFSAWSRPNRFYSTGNTLLRYGLQLEIALQDGRVLIAQSQDFDHTKAGQWQSRVADTEVGPGDIISSLTVRFILDAMRATALFDDSYLGMWCNQD